MTPQEYIDNLPEERRETLQKIREVILQNIPAGFREEISYGMIGYVVPHSIFPSGYHCDPKLPLPFLSIAAQKNFYSIYHMGIYANPELMQWFLDEYPKHTQAKLDMGKSCIRFKKPEQIPFELVGNLAAKVTPQQWIDIYQGMLTKGK